MSKSKAKSIYLKSWKILYFPGLSKMIKSTTKSSKWTKQRMFRLSPGSLGSYLPHVDFFSVWLCWVLIALHKLSLVVTSWGYSLLQCTGLSLRWPLLLLSKDFSSCGTWAQLLWCRAQLLCGMWNLPRPGIEPVSLHWQANSYLLHHQGSPSSLFSLAISSVNQNPD